MEYLKHILPNFILIFSVLYCWHKLLNQKVSFKNYKLYVTTVLSMLISIINFIIVEKFIQVVLITIVFMFLVRYLFKESIQKCIIVPIFHQLIVLLSETVIVLLVMIIFSSKFIYTFAGSVVINVSVSILSIIIVNLKFVNNLYKKVLIITNKIKLKQLMIFCFLSILLINIFVASAYYKIDFIDWIIINVVLITSFCVIILYALKTQNNFNKVTDKYNIAINSLKQYETMMTKYVIANHENKNLLLTIRAMINNKEKDIDKYIESIVKDKYEDDEKLFYKTSSIPSGGLRATIYSEILKIKENNIEYYLEIDKAIRTVDLIEMNTDDIIDICKIIGVFIDNAIEAVKGLDKRVIEISLYLDKQKLNIKISNNYKGIIEIDKIFDEGYTTKDKGHGYGLSLVKKIIDNNKILKNKVKICNNIFSQEISIKYKKSH